MGEQILLQLSSLIVLGVAAQWLAWRLRVPSILLLLGLGVLAGPVTGLLNPDALLGELLQPFVSLAVAIILYEGGLSLRFKELSGSARIVGRMVTVGAAVTGALTALAAWLVLGLSGNAAVLLASLLVVTGPTVVLPLLREIRPRGRVAAIIKWEGIIIDPIGAMLAVLVFQVLLSDNLQDAAPQVALSVVKTLVVGGGLGVATSFGLAWLLRRFLIPDHLEGVASLALAVAAFTVAEMVQPEAGLFAATSMGITLANQRLADIERIVEFKEHLRVLLISALFILLAARVPLETLTDQGLPALLFVLALVLVVRPVSVLVATIGSGLARRELAFLAAMAPRGIVAAAMASVFALRLREHGIAADDFVPLVFLTIVGTVLFSSIVAPIVARTGGLSTPDPQGVLLAGAAHWVRDVALVLKEHDIRVLIADTNQPHIVECRMSGLDAVNQSVLGTDALDDLDLGGIGRLLAVRRFARVFGRGEIYRLASADETGAAGEKHDTHAQIGRALFSREADFFAMRSRVGGGQVVKATRISEQFTFAQFREVHGPDVLLLFIITETGALRVIAADEPIEPRPGQTLISLAPSIP